MPGHHEHDSAGVWTGGVAAAFLARDQELPHLLGEVLGGITAAKMGASLPDLIDPPRFPQHRSIGHGVLPAAVAAAAYARWLEGLQRELRASAEASAAARRQATSKREKLGYLVAECLCRFLAGGVVGLASGYASHLALDARTKRGLPLVG